MLRDAPDFKKLPAKPQIKILSEAILRTAQALAMRRY
jgi:hypothetical protein